MHCQFVLYDLAMGFMCHARKRNSNGAVLEPNNRGGAAKELQSGGAIMNKLAAMYNELYTQDERIFKQSKVIT